MINKPTQQAIKTNKKPDYQKLERQNKAMKKELELRKKKVEILKRLHSTLLLRTSKVRVYSGAI